MNLMNNLEDINEEFNNFMHKVTEVSNVIHLMASGDKDLQERGTAEADQLLGTKSAAIIANLDEGDVVLRVKSDKTIINHRALREPDNTDEGTMSQEAFMASVSQDADRRYKDKLVRTEKMETFKKQATLAFRRKEYAKALCCYNKAIEQIRDSPLLYNNRSLCQIYLGIFDKAIEDAETALKLNENCLRSYLYLAKANYLQGHIKAYERAIKEAKERHPKQVDFINEFVSGLLNKDNLTNVEEVH